MKRKLKIAQLVPPWIEVPPKKYGGTELIVSYLADGLVDRGHSVTLFASGDSKTKAKLDFCFPKALYGVKSSWSDDMSSLFHCSRCFKEASKFDIIHNHFNYYGIAFAGTVNTPVITTYHGDFSEIVKERGLKYKMLQEFSKHSFVSISDFQRPKGIKLNFLKTVYNGIDVDSFEFSNTSKDYIAWIGRITPKKGILDAIQIAKKLNVKLKIAAKVDKNYLPDVEFYEQKVKPLIDGKQISYIGEIGGYKAKSMFLKNAIALVNPIKWHEPFGLNMIEAMACGTPVIAYNMGSVPEVVKDGKTGFIVKDIVSAVKSFKRIKDINRFDCREHVKTKFSKDIMVDNYEELYYKLINKK